MPTIAQLLLFTTVIAGCGDNLEMRDPVVPLDCPEQPLDPLTTCHDVSTPITATEDYIRATDFDLSTCDPESLVGADLAGIYDAPLGDFSLTECPEGFQLRGVNSGRVGFETELHRTGDGLLIRSENDFFLQAMLICGIASDGSLIGRTARCTKSVGCNANAEFALTAVDLEFERPNGEPDSIGLRLVSEHAIDSCGNAWPRAGLVSHVEYADNIAYLAVEDSGLHLIDVSDPSAPNTIGSVYASDGFYNDIALFDIGDRRYAAIAAASHTAIIDVSSPNNPFEVARMDSGSHRLDLQQNGDGTFLYTASFTLDIFELSDPSAPVSIGSVAQGWDLHAPIIAGDKLYVAAADSGFVVMDDPRNDPSNPVIHGIYQTGESDYSHHAEIFEIDGTTYALHNDEIGTERYFKIIDVTPGSPTFLQVRSEYLTDPDQPSHNVTIDGTTAYLAYYQHGVRVLDIADPANPVETAHFHTFEIENANFGLEGAVDIAVDTERGLLFVADSPRGLVILEQTN